MSPRSPTDDAPIDQLDDIDTVPPAEPTRPATAAPRTAVEQPRPRLTVRELQIALEAARGIAGATPQAGRSTRSSPPIVAPTPTQASTSQPAPAINRRRVVDAATATRPRPEPWLPEHDGPVSLSGAAAPRTRAVRRAAATPDRVARRPAEQRSITRTPRTAAIDPALAAAASAAPPRLALVAACGGAGATSATVLLGAALAPVTGALLVAAGADRGSLTVRANANGGDIDALAAWAAQHPGTPLQSTTPGLASGDAGTGRLGLLAAGRDDTGRSFDAGIAAALLAAAASTRAAVLLDWSCPAPLPERIWTSATHVLVVAPATSPGLLDAEYVVQNLEKAIPTSTPLGALIVDVRGRAPRRPGRASLARLEALDLPVTALPYDPALADDPRVHWPALRPRTRSAVFAALTHLLHPDHRKDQT